MPVKYYAYNLKCLWTRQNRMLSYAKKCLKHPINSRFFPRNENIDVEPTIRHREPFKVNFARTESYKNSTIPTCQRLLNSYFSKHPERLRGGLGLGGGGGQEQAGRGQEQAGERQEKRAGAEGNWSVLSNPDTYVNSNQVISNKSYWLIDWLQDWGP